MRSPLFDIDRTPKAKSATLASVRWKDEARFIKTWFEHPGTTGAVSPSGRSLSRTMARYVDPLVPGPIIELGPGTGPVTEALLRRGIAPERLVLVEYDASFCRLLARRYPGCNVVQGDAYSLGRTLRNVLSQPAAAIVSSLPLLNRPDAQRLALLSDAFALMRPRAPFIQFTYGLSSPIPRRSASSFVPFEARVSPPVWLNLPPARVWIYQSSDGAKISRRPERMDLFDKLKLGGERLGEEWREQRDRLRAEFVARSSEARAELKARTTKVKSSLAKHGAQRKNQLGDLDGQTLNRADKHLRW